MVNPTGETVGPFPWTLVREWFALGLVSDYAWVCPEGAETWQGLYEYPELQTLPPSEARPDGSGAGYYSSTERFRKPAQPLQHAYLRHLNCPFRTEALDFHLAQRITWQLGGVSPSLRDPEIEKEIEEESQDENFWHNDPATEKQIACLEARGVFLAPNATKGEAAALIDPASDGQRRRLSFYGTRLPRFLTKEFASRLIDRHIRKHPESEEAYQRWKQERGIV